MLENEKKNQTLKRFLCMSLVLVFMNVCERTKLRTRIEPKPRFVFSLPEYLCFPEVFLCVFLSPLIRFLFFRPLKYLNLRNEGSRGESTSSGRRVMCFVKLKKFVKVNKSLSIVAFQRFVHQ